MATMQSPLSFQPLFRRYLWGGRRLATLLGKPLGEGDDYAESWEIVDHSEDQSVVLQGPWAGETLHELVRTKSQELFGKHAENDYPAFPLLLKFLDANQTLSVQVHPTDEQAAQLQPPDLGKTEAWVVLAADQGSKIYAGLKEGVTRQQLQEALEAGECEKYLHVLEPAPGDCLFIPAGTVHALGAGLLIAEIQQASDTTFRLHDWNRKDKDGQPRPLHIEQSLETIDFSCGPVVPQQPVPTNQEGRERLIACDYFVLDRCTFSNSLKLGGDGRFHMLAVLEGEVGLIGEGLRWKAGQTCLLPAATEVCTFTTNSQSRLLDIYLP